MIDKTNEPCAAAELIRVQGEQIGRREMNDHEVKKDCFGYRGNGNCNALNWMYCKAEKCKFFKTTERFEADRRKYPFKGNGE